MLKPEFLIRIHGWHVGINGEMSLLSQTAWVVRYIQITDQKPPVFLFFEAARSYHTTPEANIVDILRLIHANWLVKIAPYSSSDCSATCLFAIQIEGIITLGRLGDGMIAALGETEENHLILSDNKQDSFSNYTNSLQQEFKPDQWETATIESAACNAVVLCTDGISDDLLPEKQMIFAQELYSTYADLESEERKRDLKRWLNEWPVPGHSDDKTIACLFKKGGSQ